MRLAPARLARRRSAPKKLAESSLAPSQIGLLQDRAGEIGIGQVAARQVQAGQIAEGEDRPRPAHAAGIEHFMAGDGGADILLGQPGKAGMPGLGHGEMSLG